MIAMSQKTICHVTVETVKHDMFSPTRRSPGEDYIYDVNDVDLFVPHQYRPRSLRRVGNFVKIANSFLFFATPKMTKEEDPAMDWASTMIRNNAGPLSPISDGAVLRLRRARRFADLQKEFLAPRRSPAKTVSAKKASRSPCKRTGGVSADTPSVCLAGSRFMDACLTGDRLVLRNSFCSAQQDGPCNPTMMKEANRDYAGVREQSRV